MNTMVDLPILQPLVFGGLIEKMMTNAELVLLNRFPKRDTTELTASWDEVRGTRQAAKPNVPNAEAHIVARPGYSSRSASWIYLREKMVFEPSTSMGIRAAGQGVGDRMQANEMIARDVQVLSNRFDNFAEICWWSAMAGRISARYADNNWDVDYGFPTTHTPVFTNDWATATPAQIMSDIIGLRDLVRRDSGEQANEAFVTQHTMNLIFNAWANVENGSALALLTDRMRDSYYNTGTFDGFMGLQWNKVESSYQQESGTFADFVPDGALYIGNYTANNPMVLMQGPSRDFAAPPNFVGKFAKNWMADDPSGRTFLLEWSIMPVIYRPEQLVHVRTVSPSKYPVS